MSIDSIEGSAQTEVGASYRLKWGLAT